jgi:hypothetical protein
VQTLNRTEAVIRQLKAEEANLHLRLNQVCRALAELQGPRVEVGLQRRPCRAELLRQYLLDHPDGVRLKDVPSVLAAMGHVSFAANPTTNWLYQLKLEKAYFAIDKGIVKLCPNFRTSVPSPSVNRSSAPADKKTPNEQLPVNDKPEADDANADSASHRALQADKENAAATTGGNP